VARTFHHVFSRLLTLMPEQLRGLLVFDNRLLRQPS
jgi:hypothetical protein